MKRPLILMSSLLVILFAATGCPRDKFEIVMERTADGVHRTVTVSRVDDDKSEVPPEITEPLTAAYGAPVRSDNGDLRFSKAFTGKLPADLHHAGFTNFADVGVSRSPLGEVFTYLERLPGQVRVMEVARAAARASDVLVRALEAGLSKRLALEGDAPKAEKLHRFLQNELREDALSVGLILWIHLGAADDEETVAQQQATHLVYAYLGERGYLSAADTVDDETAVRAVWDGAVRKLAAELGYAPDQPLPAALAALSSEEAGELFQSGLEAIGFGEEEFTELCKPLIGEMFGPQQSGTITWKCAREPAETNGKWDAEKKAVAWEGQSVSGAKLPYVLYARWASPAEEFQRKRFGRIVLDGELVAYNAWYTLLDEPDRKALDAFLDGLEAGPDIAAKLAAFRLESQKAEPLEGEGDQPPHGVLLIIEALNLATGTEPRP